MRTVIVGHTAPIGLRGIALPRGPVLTDRDHSGVPEHQGWAAVFMQELITPEGILAGLKVGSKKQALQELSRRAAAVTGQHERGIFDVLLERERLGTTGVGNGIAIPHGKLANLDRVYGLFARLERPIDFDAIDEQPVDLVFLLLAPEQAGADHLKALSRVSRLLRDAAVCEKLRGCSSADAIYAILTQTDDSNSHAA